MNLLRLNLYHFVVFVVISVVFSSICIAQTGAESADGSSSAKNAVERPGWLGVGLRNQEADAEQNPKVIYPIVKNVFRNSPAERAGILAGDVVIAIGDTELTGGMKQMISIVQSHNEGTEVVVRIDRNGKNETFRVVLATPPARGDLIKNEWIGRPLPALALRDVQTDEVVSLPTHLGKVVVIDYWATWCGPCKVAMPIIEELYARYKDDGLVVIGVSDEERQVVEKFEINRPVEYIMAYDAESSIASNLFINSYPTFLVIDKKGNLTNVLLGVPGAQQLDSIVGELIKQPTQ
ncbi:MAG: redoxin domain-containing protein [Myxococcales bacterium]|nr:redoxin domain-containing protein [Myxococcales bacterium]